MRKNRAIILSIAVVMAIVSLMFLGSTVYYSKRNDALNKTKMNNTLKNKNDDTILSNNGTTLSNNGKILSNTSTTSLNNRKTRMNNTKVKGIYLTASTAANSQRVDEFVKLANTTEINAFVIDIKEGGHIYYLSQVPLVKNNKLSINLYNPTLLIKKLHDNDIYVIGRIVCFRDDGLATKRPDLAIRSIDAAIWRESGKGSAWINPFIKETWEYNVNIAKEAVEKGFDEIQFDYVRFPTAKKTEVSYDTMQKKTEAINFFLSYAKHELTDKLGIPISADVFGIIAESSIDGETIGQDITKIGMDISCISPMIYPSHYANSSKGAMGNGVGQFINGVLFTAPDLQPYEVVYNSLVRIKEKTAKIVGYKAKIRPYLQDFTATYLPKAYRQTYGVQQIRQQIKAVYDAGYEEWLLWNAKNIYTESALNKQ